jgi:hypothetical protein
MNKLVLLNILFVLLTKAGYTQLPSFIPYRIDNKWGYTDSNKNIRIPIMYDSVELFVPETKYGQVYLDGVMYYIDTLGKTYSLYEAPEAATKNPWDGGVYTTVTNLNIKTKSQVEFELLRSKYDYHFKFNDWYYLVKKGKQYAVSDTFGNLVTPLYDSIILRGLKDEIVVRENGKFGKVNFLNQNIIIPIKYDSLFAHSNTYSIVLKNKLSGLFKYSNQIIPFKYQTIKIKQAVNGIYMVVKENGKYGLLDSNGLVKIKPIYDTIAIDTYNGVIWIKQDEKFALFNKVKNIVTEFKYNRITGNCSPELIPVKVGNKWSIINSIGKEIFKPIFDDVKDEEWNGYLEKYWQPYNRRMIVLTKLKGKWGYVDYKGTEYWQD